MIATGVPISPPVMVVLPVPPMTAAKVPVRLASVVEERAEELKKLLLVLNVAAPVIVAAPKVMPAVPLVTSGPAFTVRVLAPILSVPSVSVVPTSAELLSETIVTLPPTVVLRAKFSPPASCSVPAVSVRVPAPSALILPVARRIPAVSVVVPV